MGIGDFLKETANLAYSLAPVNLAGSALTKATGDNTKPNWARSELPSSFQMSAQGVTKVGTPTQLPAALGTAASHVWGFDQAMQIFDVTRRSIDTALISAQHADAVGAKSGKSTDWSEFFNKGTWTKAWDLANYENATSFDGSVESPRSTGGQVFIGGMLMQNSALDPFDAEDAKRLQAEANGTWYGRTMTAAMDLGESFIAPPGMGQLARVRGAAGANTIIDAERAAQRYNEVGAVGRTAGQKAADTAHRVIVPNTGAQNVDSMVQRVVEGLRPIDGDLDPWSVFEKLKARMELAPEGEISKLANQNVEINKIADPALRERLRTNLHLASMGSTTAKKELIREHPLFAKNFENLTSTIREPGAFTELYAARLEAGEDLPVNDIIERHWNTKGDIVERDKLKEHVKALKNSKREHDRLVSELKDLRPKVHNTPEAQHVKAKRAEKHDEVRKLETELRTARQDLHGTKRWAAGAAKKADGVGATGDVVDFNQAIGDARRRVEDVTARLKAAREDRDLLDSTPLHDPTLLDDWRSMVDEARVLRSGVGDALDAAKAERQGLAQQIAAKEAEIRTVAPLLSEANKRVSELLDIAGPDSMMALAGDAKPTLLNRLKEHMRSQIGIDHTLTVGEGNTMVRLLSLPDDKMRRTLAPAARGHIALNEIGLGARQLEDVMLRSGVFSREEMVAARSELIQADAATRYAVVARIQDHMFNRVAVDWFKKKLPELTEEQAIARANELTSLTRKHWGQGNDWVTRAANEQVSSDLVFIRDIDGEWVGYDGPTLRSQLADSAPMLDPWEIKRALDNEGHVFALNIRNGVHLATNAHDFMLKIWKTGALLRPGLAVRSMIDTGPRALASLSAGEAMVSAMNGAVNFTHNRALKGLAKVQFGGLTPDVVQAKMRVQGVKPIAVGGRKFALYKDNLDLEAKMAAMAKGDTPHQALNHDMSRQYDKFALDRSSWKRNSPDSAKWHIGYKEYATQFLNSPVGRMVADLTAKIDDGVDMAKLREQIKSSPEFTREYRVYAQQAGLTRSMYLDQLLHEASMMFPSEKLLNAAKNGGLHRKLIEREFPRERRFEIPSPEEAAIGAKEDFSFGKKIVDGMFRLFLDKPDMWLARHPVAVNIYNGRVRQEVQALLAHKGREYRMTDREWELIDERSRNAAIGYVRHTFFDTTRYTGAHRALSRFSPFIAAWEDAMISWGRLIYDDPRRLVKLSAAYHAPYTLAASQNINLVQDEAGNPITRGTDVDGVFVAIPAPVAKAVAKAFGRDTHGMGAYRMRLDAINSIWQGETWWLPGVGPTVAAPLTYVLGSGNVVSREAALELADTDSPMGKAILKSVFLGGEVPASDPKSIAMSTTPGWVRTAFTQYFGEGRIRTQTYAFNQLVLEAQANGDTLDDKKFAEIRERSERMANAAATVRLAMTAGLGFTGSATVDAQFYVDQMHIIQAMPPEMRVDKGGNQLSPEEFFAQEYPEAADLDWGVTTNKTGITASVHAAKSEARLQPLLKNNPEDIGWMVLGRDNVVDPEFSRTAYAMQKSDGNRVYKDATTSITEAQAAVGYKQLNAWTQQIADQLVASGFDETTVTQSKEYRVAKSALREYLTQTNPAFAQQSSQFFNRRDYYYDQARRLSTSGPLKGRSDMVTFRDYDAARTEVLNHFGIKSFNGTKPEYAQAKEVMQQVGTKLAQQDIGFQQMWDKFLEREVE